MHYVYKTTNKENGKYYVGVHKSENIQNDSYLGSGYILAKAIEKYGKESFTREILFEFETPEEAFEKEREIVNEEFVKNEQTYNIALGGHGGNIVGNHSEETKKLISELHKGKTLTEDHKLKIGIGVKESIDYQNYIHSEENSKRVSLMRTGQTHSEETKQHLSEVHTGKTHSEETKIKMSENSANKGVPKSEEFKEHLSELFKGRTNEWNQITNKDPEKIRKTAEKHTGMKRSEEACKNISESKKGKTLGENSHEFKGYWVTPFGKYSSSLLASKELDIQDWKIRIRCNKNDKFITKNDVTKDPKISENDIGKTWKEIGWGFEPVIKEKL